MKMYEKPEMSVLELKPEQVFTLITSTDADEIITDPNNPNYNPWG